MFSRWCGWQMWWGPDGALGIRGIIALDFMQPPVACVTAVSPEVHSQPLKVRLGELWHSLRRSCACFPTPSRPGQFCLAAVGCCNSTLIVFCCELYKCSEAAMIQQRKRKRQLQCLCWACAMLMHGLISSVSCLRWRVGLRETRLPELCHDLVQRVGWIMEILCALFWMCVHNPSLDHLRRTIPRKVTPAQHSWSDKHSLSALLP